jgi:hypothetical protein
MKILKTRSKELKKCNSMDMYKIYYDTKNLFLYSEGEQFIYFLNTFPK